MTGCGCGPASSRDPPRAETFFALRHQPPEGAKCGRPPWPVLFVEKGFRRERGETYGAQVASVPPKRTSETPWPKPLRRWRAGVRRGSTATKSAIIPFRLLDRERPHDLAVGPVWRRRLRGIIFVSGCMDHPGRPRLAFAELVELVSLCEFAHPSVLGLCLVHTWSHTEGCAAFLTRSRAGNGTCLGACEDGTLLAFPRGEPVVEGARAPQ